MKIICNPIEAAELIYNCGTIENCDNCVFKTFCDEVPHTMLDMIFIKGKYGEEKFIQEAQEEESKWKEFPF